MVVDYPLDRIGRTILSSPPYAGPEGLSLLAVLVALAVVGWVTRARWFRLLMVGIGAMLLVYTVTFEVMLPLVAVVWGVVALASLALVRRVVPIDLLPGARPQWPLAISERAPYAAVGLALFLQVVASIRAADPIDFARHVVGWAEPAGTPFLDERSAVIATLAVTILLAGIVWRGVVPALVGAIGAGAAIAWLLPFEVRPAYAVAGWALIALAGFVIAKVVPAGRLIVGIPSIGLWTYAAAVALVLVAPLDRLVVDGTTTVVGLVFMSDASAALGALAIAAAVGGYLHRAERVGLPALAVAGVATVYLLSIAVVDQFQMQVGYRPFEELQKGAQVGLTVLWSILGAGAFAIGLVTHRTPIRLFGLALLGIATVKVFIVDLAALDVAYRVLSLVALGILLLVSAAVYSRMTHPHGPIAPQHP